MLRDRLAARALLAGIAITGFYLLKLVPAYFTSPTAHRGEFMTLAGLLGLLGAFKWALDRRLSLDPKLIQFSCGGTASAGRSRNKGGEVRCSRGCTHDRAEIGAALSAARAYIPDSRAWITVSQMIAALGFGAGLAPVLGLGLFGQGFVVALSLAFVLALHSRSGAAKWLAGSLAFFFLIYLVRDELDGEDWASAIISGLVLPFALIKKDDHA